MGIRKAILWILPVIILMVQTGCSKQIELDNLAVVTGIFLEKNQNGYILIADCMNFSGQEQTQSLQTKTIQVSAPSLKAAFSTLHKQSEMPLYFYRAKVFVIGKELSQNSEKSLLDELFGLQIVPGDICVLRANFPREEMLLKEDKSFGIPIHTKLQTQESCSDIKLYQLIKNPEKISEIPTVYLSENGFWMNADYPP